MEKTFAMIKPNAVHRNLIGEIILRFERKGLILNGLKLVKVSKEQAKKLYDVHEGKPFYNDLVKSITSDPVVVMCISGVNAVALVRLLAGATNPLQALPGTIRGDFSSDLEMNVIHSSDSVERAEHERRIFFSDDELVEYNKRLTNDVFTIKKD